jgi:E3 ubiquitin-protein ligase UBR4
LYELTYTGESGSYKRKRGKSSSNVLDTAAAAANDDDTNSGSGGSDSNAAALTAAKPMIIYFGLINKAHSMCAAATTTSSGSSTSSSSSGDSDSVQSVANWVAQRDSEEVLSLGSALLHHFERELVPAATAEAHIKACASITTTASAVVSAAAAAANESDLYLTDDTTASDARTAVETVSEKFASLVQEGELMAACESA